MVTVGGTYRYNHVSHAQVECRRKTLLNPELFEGDLAAPFDFRLIFAGLLLFDFDGALGPAVFKLDFAAHAPAPAEVIAQKDDHVRQVESSVMFALVQVGVLVFLVVVAEKVERGYGFTISAEGEAGSLFLGWCCLGLGLELLTKFFQNFGFQFSFQ